MKALSIIICTFNRQSQLKKVLYEIFRQFKELSLTSDDIKKVINDIELIIVDNNSSDETGSMIFNMISQKENGNLELKYLIEIEQGSSKARNRGIKESYGNTLAFLDDDILLDKNWLSQVYSLVKEKPQKFVRGTKVIPLWASDIPEWLSLEPPFEIIQSCFPSHDYGEEPKKYPFFIDLDDEQEEDFNFLGSLAERLNYFRNKFRRKVLNPISACFLASRDVFDELGDFRLDLGIQGKERGACEDTELFWRFIASGIEVIYEPRVKVYHPIPPTRMTKKFILTWYNLLGRTLAYIQKKGLNHLSPGPLESERKIYLKLFLLRFFHLLSLLLLDPIKTFWFEAQIAKSKGTLDLIKIENRNNFTKTMSKIDRIKQSV